MRLPTYVSLAVLAVLLAAAIVLPGTPAVRGAVVERLVAAAADAGFDVVVGAARGNLWRGVTLHGVSVTGPGSDATAETVRVRYFLPPLLAGDLPVGVQLDGLDGEIDVAQLVDAVAGPPSAAPPAVRVRLQSVEVTRSRLGLAGIPFTLPDVAVEGMQVTTLADGIRADLDLVTREGRAELVVHTAPGSDTVDIEVVAADAAIARHWWDGIQGGTGRGRVRVSGGVVEGDLTVEDGALRALGVDVRDIAGPITWRGHDIDASLSGALLGGTMRASGRVDVLAQRWQAVGEADAELDEVVAALWALGAPGSPPPSEGGVRAGVRAQGWTLAHVDVEAVANGTLLGEPLEDFDAHVVWDSVAGLTVDGDGGWGGGSASGRVRSVRGASEVEASLTDATWSGVLVDTASADFRLGTDPRGVARMTGSWPGPLGPLALESDLTLDADGASLFLHADAPDLLIEGAVVAPGLHGDAPLEGSVGVRMPSGWWTGGAPPLTLDVRGTLAAPSLEATVGGGAPARPALPGLALDLDLRGTLTAIVGEGGVDVSGALGALLVDGGWGGGRELEITSERLAITEPVRTEVTGGRAVLAPGDTGWRLRAEGDLARIDAALPLVPLSVAPLGRFTLEGDATRLEARDDGGRIELVQDGGEVRATFAEVGLAAGETALTARGSALRPADGEWSGSGHVSGAGVDVAVRGTGGDAVVELALAAGSALGPWRPGVDVHGTLTLEGGAFAADARAGELSALASGTVGEAGASWQADVRHGGMGIEATGEGGAWTASGALPLPPLLELVGVAAAVDGSVGVELAAAAGGEPAGTVRLATVQPAPLDAEVVIGAGRADAVASGTLFGETLQAHGQLWPVADATLSWGAIGPVRFSGDAAAGSGTLPSFELAALRIPEQAWSLDLDLAAATATARLGASEATASWAGPASAQVRVDQPLELAGSSLRLAGGVAWTATAPAGSVALTLEGPELGLLASLDGDLERADVVARAPAAALAQALGAPLGLAGELTLAGVASLTTPSGRLEGEWRAGDDVIAATVQIDADDWAASLSGRGLTAEATQGAWSLVADAFAPERWLALPELAARVDGALASDDGGWSGSLEAVVEAPLAATVALRGEGDALHVDARAEGDGYAASLVGAWGDAPRFDVEGRVADPGGTVDGSVVARGVLAPVDGAWAGRGSATATAGGAEPVAWPALAADWVWEDGRLRIGGTQGVVGVLSVGPNGLTGALQLPIEVGTLGHRLRLDAGDELALTLDGPSLQLGARPAEDGWRLTGTAADLGSWRIDGDPLPWAAAVGPLELEAHVTDDAGAWRWELNLSGDALLGRGALPLSLAAAGVDTSGSGRLTIGAADAPAAQVTLGLRAGVATAAIDGGDVDVADLGRLLDLPLAGELTGRASLALGGDGLDLRADLRAELAYDGTPFGARLLSDATGAWSARAATGDGTWSASLEAPDRATLAQGGATVVLAGPGTSLRGRLAVAGDHVGLRLGGSAAGRTVSLSVSGDGRSATGNATWGASRLDVDLAPERLSARGHVARGDAPAGPWSIALDVDPGSWSVERLTLQARGADARLDLHGGTFPVDLAGTLSWNDLQRPIRVRQQDDAGWRLDVDTLALTLAADGHVLGEGAASLVTSGTRVDLDLGTLGWHRDSGWQGAASATLALDAQGAQADVSVRAGAPGTSGGAPLRASVEAHQAGAHVGSATLELPSDPAGALGGAIDLDLALGEGSLAWRLTAAGPIGGSLTDPTVDAALTLTGPVDARGRLRVDGGSLRADLAGPDLSLTARLDGSGWRAQARVTDADVSAFLPWLERPRLDVGVDARSGDGGIEVVADTLRLGASGSSVSGAGRLAPGGELRVTFRSDVDLADLNVAADVVGRVQGPLTLRYDLGTPWTDADLTGMLALSDVAIDGVPGTFDGDVQIAGPTADPRLQATLQARGDAAGSVRADVRPRLGTVRVDADLRAGDLQATLRAALDDSALTADGRVAVGALALALRSDQGGVALAGEGALTGWTGRLQAHPWSLALAGDLGTLTPVAQGALDAVLTWPGGDGPWPAIAGGWRGAALGPLRLPDAEVRSDDDGSWSATAPGLAARLHLPSGGWSLHLAGAPVVLADEELELAVSATGTGADARATATLAGSIQGHPVDLSGSAESGEQLALRAAGALLGGRLDAEAVRDRLGRWSGDGALVHAELAGSPLEAALRLVSGGEAPQGSADVRWGDDLLAASASYRGGRLETQAEVLVPGGVHLAASGALWPVLDLTLTSPAPGVPAAAESMRLHGSWDGPEPLRVDGALALEIAGVRLRVSEGTEGTPRIEVAAAALPEVAFAAELPLAPAAGLLALVEGGVAFEASGAGAGRVIVGRDADGWGARLDALSLPVAGAVVRADGRLASGAGSVRLVVDLPDTLGAVVIPGLPLHTAVEGHLVLEDTLLRLTTAAPWAAVAEVDLARRAARVDADLAWQGPDGPSRVVGRLDLDALEGLRGELEAVGIHVSHPEAAGALRVDGAVRGSGGALEVQGTARARRSSVALTGTLPLPDLARAGWGLDDGSALDATARIAALDLEDLPWIADVAPGVTGAVTGSVAVREGRLIGQLVAEELALAGTPLPSSLTLAGDHSGLDARLELGTRRQAVLTGSWRDGQADVLARLERFPLHTVVESMVGRGDVTALVTGVARAGWDPSRPDALDLRLATEDVRLERAGVVTTGTLTFELADGALVIREASFAGQGTWSARGEIRPDRLDLELVAEDADFGPLLGLVPALARYGVAAEGDLELVGRGTLAHPTLRLRSEGLRVSVAGTSYELSEGAFDLVGQSLELAAVVRGVAPLGGEVRVSGDGVLGLQPFALVRADLQAVGDLDVPVIGRVSAVDAEVRARAGAAPTLRLDGRLGAPLRIEGTLAPFDVRGTGRGLVVGVPDVFVSSATIDADLRARVDDGFVVDGRLDVAQARLDLAARAAARADAPPAEVARDEASRRAALQLLRFDGVRITAPQRVSLSEAIGTAEASIDLTLTGDAADPRLDGTVNALRGTFRFSGQDLDLTRGVARFEPARGILPVLEIEARARFEKARVASAGVRFTAPPGPRFDVVLRFEAEVSATGPGGSVNVDLVPQLTSDALIEVASGPDGLSAGTRPLSELELLSLIALGRIEVGGGTEALASTFAQRAIDTAVDLLVVAELQAALSEALGLDVVEIRTTALADLFDGRSDPFGVSLRFGGYLSDELFASYRVGTFDDAEREFAVTNELAFTYELGPVAFDLAGRIDFPAITTNAPVPSLTGSVRYDVSRSFAFEAGLDVGSASQTARFGVTIRW